MQDAGVVRDIGEHVWARTQSAEQNAEWPECGQIATCCRRTQPGTRMRPQDARDKPERASFSSYALLLRH
eukprot:7473725-Lingulodinium_polyedra.AAC.1